MSPRSYPPPLRFARAVCSPSGAVPALRLGPEAQAPHRVGAPVVRLGAGDRALRHRRAGGEVEDPGRLRALPRDIARAGAGGPHGEPLARPRRQRRDPPAGRAAQRHRLRRDRALEPAARARAGGLGRPGRDPLRPHAGLRPVLARPGALPLPVAAAGRHPPRGAPVLQPHQRGPAVGPLRRPGVPAH